MSELTSPPTTAPALSHPWWEIRGGGGPIVATAIHDGHAVSADVAAGVGLSADERLREEDPGTGLLAAVGDRRVVAGYSRFEVDFNRPLAAAVYRKPDDAWGLPVWPRGVPDEVLARGHAGHRAFYQAVERLLEEATGEHGKVALYDLHSYNHRRGGPQAPPADPVANPEINVGTGGLDRARWGPLVDRFIAELGAVEVAGRHLDVRENVRFEGGHFPRWVAATFPETVCPLAIEVKKFYIDEWTGEIDEEALAAIRGALAATVPGVTEELAR